MANAVSFLFFLPLCRGRVRRSAHLLEYLHLVPFQEVGFPTYYASLNRKLGDARNYNLIYQTSPDIFVHVYSNPKDKRDLYIPVEPSLVFERSDLLVLLDQMLLDYTNRLAERYERYNFC